MKGQREPIQHVNFTTTPKEGTLTELFNIVPFSHVSMYLKYFLEEQTQFTKLEIIQPKNCKCTSKLLSRCIFFQKYSNEKDILPLFDLTLCIMSYKDHKKINCL